MRMICPRCSAPLTAGPHGTGVSWRCGRCRGQSLNFSQLRKLIPRLQANEIWLTVVENPVAARWHACCPECLQRMCAVLVPFPEGTAELDVCLACQRLWMDHRTGAPQLADASDERMAPGLPVVRMEGRRLERRLDSLEPDAEKPQPFLITWLATLWRRVRTRR